MNNKIVSFWLFCFSLILFLFGNLRFTGAVIGTNFSFSFFNFLGFVFLMGSFMFLLVRQSLDAIMIPTGPRDSVRVQGALEEYKQNPTNYIIISGEIQRDDSGKVKKDAQVYQIYNNLRQYGIKPRQMIIEGKSKNTLENVLYSLEKLKKKGLKDVGIATGQTHFWRFDEMVDKAREEGLVDKDFHVYNIRIPENTKEKAYGFLAYLKDHFKLQRYGLRNSSKNN